MRRIPRTIAALLLTVPLLGACASDDDPAIDAGEATTTTEAAAPTIAGNEYSFQVPGDLKGGTTTWVFENTGKEPHAFNVMKVDGTHSPDEVKTALTTEGPPPAWLLHAGGTTLDPGATIEYTGTYEPGSYAIFCPIPGPEGKTHASLGMLAQFDVAEGAAGGAFPSEDATVVAKDFTWTGADKMASGEQTVKFVNSGPEDHEIVMFKLQQGKTAKDVAAFFGPDAPPGPPPFTGIPGLVGPLKAGQQAVVKTTFEAGPYALFCFVTNRKGPHFLQGMMADITVT